MNDRDRPPIFNESDSKECEDCFGHVYVDKIGVLAATWLRAEKVTGKLTSTFDDAGFRSVIPRWLLLGRFWIVHVVGALSLHAGFGNCGAGLTPFGGLRR